MIDFQKDLQIKLVPNLTRSAVEPPHFNKMKVSTAMHIFSKSASAGLRYLVDKENRSSDYLTTAWFLDFCNHWFDLMSSRHPVLALSKTQPEKYDAAISFLNSVVALFSQIKIGKGTWKPVQTGVIMSTTSVLSIQNELLDSGFKFLLTARLTQDCLESLFSMVRIKNPIPTPLAFKYALKSLCVSQCLKFPNRNGSYFEDDRDKELAVDLFSSPKESEPPESIIDFDLPIVESDSPNLGEAERSALYYIFGYCVKSLKNRGAICDACAKAIETEEPCIIDPKASLTNLKEYKPGSLIKVNDRVFLVMLKAELMFRGINEQVLSKQKDLKATLVSQAEALVSETQLPTCHEVKKKLLRRYFDVRLMIYCREANAKIKINATKDRSDRGSKSVAMRNLVKRIK